MAAEGIPLMTMVQRTSAAPQTLPAETSLQANKHHRLTLSRSKASKVALPAADPSVVETEQPDEWG